MKSLARIAAFLMALGLAAPFAAAERLPVTDATGAQFETDTRPGHFTALHFFPDGASAAAYAKELGQVADSVAGVRHAVIVSGGTAGAGLYRDADGKAAAKFGAADDMPTTVLLDAKGRDVFRRSADSAVPFETIAAQVRILSRNSALSEYNLKKDRLAIGGYDPVAYFADDAAREGNPSLRSEYRGATYRFASPANRALFAAAPEKYVPAYGGWCATAMAKGEKAEADPKSYKVSNGRLFLFYTGIWGNAIDEWKAGEQKLAAEADANWKSIAGE